MRIVTLLLESGPLGHNVYVGRFAPSPTGPLHLGSLAAALASWVDARAHGGNWLIRIENIDPPRERPGAAELQLATLARFGMISDRPVLYQDTRSAIYDAALRTLTAAGQTYRCDCSRSLLAQGGAGGPYPGTCRARRIPPDAAAAVRLRVPAGAIAFVDRWQGRFEQDLAQAVGDFILRRRDGLWTYQLAVVLDDAAQGVTDVVRGADLLDNTPRQILLQRALGLGTPRYLHVPLVRDAHGRKLAKQDAAPPLLDTDALAALERAWQHLGFAPTEACTVADFQSRAVALWAARWVDNAARRAAPAPGTQEPA